MASLSGSDFVNEGSDFLLLSISTFEHVVTWSSPILLQSPEMGTKKSDGKRSLKEMEDEGEEEDEETVLGFLGDDEEEKKKRNFSKKGKRGGGGAAAEAACQVDDCTADMSGAKSYYRRHKVCELHARAAVAPVAGLRQRFCQQCSRFHDVSEFDDNKRSCRHRLAGHNERRRKSSSNEHYQGEGSSYLS